LSPTTIGEREFRRRPCGSREPLNWVPVFTGSPGFLLAQECQKIAFSDLKLRRSLDIISVEIGGERVDFLLAKKVI
jgi:hypothetical protein